jgi:hypothetical protein
MEGISICQGCKHIVRSQEATLFILKGRQLFRIQAFTVENKDRTIGEIGHKIGEIGAMAAPGQATPGGAGKRAGQKRGSKKYMEGQGTLKYMRKEIDQLFK